MTLSLTRLFFVIALSIYSILTTLPSFIDASRLAKYWPSFFPQAKISLGLDLQGGSSLLLEADVDTVIKERIRNLKNEVRKVLRQNRVRYQDLAVNNDKVTLQLRDTSQKDKAYKYLRKLGMDYSIQFSGDNIEISFTPAALQEQEKIVLDQSIEVVRRRIDEMGTKEPLIQRQGTNRILLQLPGVESPEDAKRLLGKTAKLTFHAVKPTAGMNTIQVNQKINHNGQTIETEHILDQDPLITGDMVMDAKPYLNQERNEWQVSLSMDQTGARIYADFTKANVGKPVAIVLDNKVITAPIINEPIPTGNSVISGQFTAKSSHELAMLLRAGSLPAPLKILEERTVGPDLGADSIAAGKTATLVAIIAVFAYMLLYYGLNYGGVACVALFFNLTLLIAGLTLLGATLTLPGIAGIALTLGMAVDANVLIFERIREELSHTKRVSASIQAGFSRAISTIVDSNLTTLIGAGLLYQFGTGPVRGFAVTLTLGILISMFTAITLTKTLLIIVYKLKGAKPLSFDMKEVK
ncbi:MAG: protein translocase subunit SecD [Rickettsiales bacterium]|nr:protein translocase subunit SecD [Rickettsiales bacterium]